MSEYTEITVKDDGPVAVIHLDRPEKLNALTEAFWPQMRDALARLEANGTTRAVVLTGSGDKAFSAGGDIAGFGDLDGAAAKRAFQADCLRTFAAVEECGLPVVAAVNGYAFGGGCELALACDLVLASDRASFAMPESAIGLVPGFGVLRGPAVMGRHWTKWMVLAGERIDAEQAERIGLVQRVVPHETLLDEAVALGERIARAAPLAVRIGKQMINRGVDRGETGYSLEAVTLLQETADTAEGIAAFTEKRPPRFEGALTVEPFVALMRRYVVDYTNSHDMAVCDEIMEPDYVLRMGPHVVAGRDEAYKPATRRQLEQFPGLGLTVHEVVTDGERLALRFSEHGASVRHDGAVAVWGGIGLYAWNGRRLTANRVEQDYLARRRQLAGGVPDTVAPPAPAPWDTEAREPAAAVARTAQAWAEQGLPAVGDVVLDDGRDHAALVEPESVVVDDLFTAGDRAAIHVTVQGAFRGGLEGCDEHIGSPATLHAAAVVAVAGGRVVGGQVIRDRLGLVKALTPAGARS